METGYIKLLYLSLHKSITMANPSADGIFCYKLSQHLLFQDRSLFITLQQFHPTILNWTMHEKVAYNKNNDTVVRTVMFKAT